MGGERHWSRGGTESREPAGRPAVWGERRVTPFGENVESVGTHLLKCLKWLGKMVLIQ